MNKKGFSHNFVLHPGTCVRGSVVSAASAQADFIGQGRAECSPSRQHGRKEGIQKALIPEGDESSSPALARQRSGYAGWAFENEKQR